MKSRPKPKPKAEPIDARRERQAPVQEGVIRSSVPPTSPGGRGGYDVDDEVFFHGDKGPTAGRVVCHGTHGCTVDDSAGKRHQVTWDRVLGLKGRKSFNARLVDKGASGSILEREDGSRFYVAGDAPIALEPDSLDFGEDQEDAPLMRKALSIERLEDLVGRIAQPLSLPELPDGAPIVWMLNAA